MFLGSCCVPHVQPMNRPLQMRGFGSLEEMSCVRQTRQKMYCLFCLASEREREENHVLASIPVFLFFLLFVLLSAMWKGANDSALCAFLQFCALFDLQLVAEMATLSVFSVYSGNLFLEHLRLLNIAASMLHSRSRGIRA